MDFATNLSRAWNRFSGGILGWILGENPVDDFWNAERALSYAPVWSCISTISGAFMIMPLNIHRKRGRDISVETRHSSYRLLRWRPNAYQTPSQWKRQMMCHALLWGNARSYIVRDEQGKPVELIPLMPDRTITMMLEGQKVHATILGDHDRLKELYDGRELSEIVQEVARTDPEKMLVIPDSEVWHVPGLGFDGINGVSLLSVARRSWEIGINEEKHIKNQQKKGYAGGLMLEAPPGTMRSEADAKEFVDAFNKFHSGTENSGKVALLREGITAKVLAMSNADAQFVEQRRFQREDAALWFLLQGIIGDSSGASYASLEQKNLAYRTNCLAPWTTAIEEECDIKLLRPREIENEYYHKFNDGALLRTEKSQTMAFISQGITARVLSPNEGRQMLDMNPYDGGDEYLNPAIDKKEPATKQEQDDAMTAERSRVAHLIGVEANRVVEAAENAIEHGRNYIAWIDDFYTNRWPQKLAKVLAEIGCDSEFAESHCRDSMEQLLKVAGDSTEETLVDNVRRCVHGWTDRVINLKRIELCSQST